MRPNRRLAVLVLAVGLVGPGLAGCSGTPDPGGRAGPPVGSATSSPDRTAPGSSTVPAASATAPGSVVPGSAPAPPAEDFCTQMRLADESSRASAARSRAPTRDDIDRFVLALERARAAGPPEVREPLATLIDTYRRFAEILEEPSSAKVGELDALFFDVRVTAADAKVREVVERACGFRMSGASATSAPPAR